MYGSSPVSITADEKYYRKGTYLICVSCSLIKILKYLYGYPAYFFECGFYFPA
jgi:hypothetical protein